MPLTWRRIALLGGAVAAFLLLFPLPAVRSFYALELPRGELGFILIAGLGAAALTGFWMVSGRAAAARR